VAIIIECLGITDVLRKSSHLGLHPCNAYGIQCMLLTTAVFIRSISTVTVAIAVPLTINTLMIVPAAELIRQTRSVLTCSVTATNMS